MVLHDFSLNRLYAYMDFWSETHEEAQIADAESPGTDVTLPDVVVSGMPEGVGVKKVVAMFKFRAVENTNASANKLSGAQHIQVRDDTPGEWANAIALAADIFGVAGSTREGADVVIGGIDISSVVAGDDTYNFKWAAALADYANLQFNDVQVGIRVYYK